MDFLSPNRPLYHKLLSVTSCFLLQQVVTEPTHFSHPGILHLSSTLFLYETQLSSFPVALYLPSLLQIMHLGILVTYKLHTTNKRPNSCRRTVWCYSQGDFEKAIEMLDSVDWDLLLDEPDIDHCWQTWQSTYLNIISKCIPIKRSFPAEGTFPGAIPLSVKQSSRETPPLKPIQTLRQFF